MTAKLRKDLPEETVPELSRRRRETRLGKGDKVRFCVRRGEHNLLAGRPGEVVGRRGQHLVVRCTEEGTASNGQQYLVPETNLRKTSRTRKERGVR
jgi:hypothetical protein